MTNPYPLPRETRETPIFAGDGRLTYGPFGFKIWDAIDVVAEVSRGGADYALEPVQVDKVSDAIFADFTVTFSSSLTAADLARLVSRRLHERSTDVVRGGTISGAGLEGELSKQATVLQELRRDVSSAGTGLISPGLPPATVRQGIKNHLWAGHFAVAQAGGGFKTKTDRTFMLDGMTGCRLDGSGGYTILQDIGIYHAKACRFWRTINEAGTSPLVIVWPMSSIEAKALIGHRCFVSWYAWAGANFSAPNGEAYLEVLCSSASQQPITRRDGRYSGGNRVLSRKTFRPGQEPNRFQEPFWVSFDVPDDAEQIAFVLTVPSSGSAGADDWLTMEALHTDRGNFPTQMPDQNRFELLPLARQRYRATYPYGLPPGIPTAQNARRAIATSNAVSGSVVFREEWDDSMLYAPSIIAFTALSSATGQGGSPRIYHQEQSKVLAARVRTLSDRGYEITNNGATVAGDTYLSHSIALALL